MKEKILVACILCSLLLTGCSSSIIRLDNTKNNNGISEEADNDLEASDDGLWNTPMSDFIPESPFSNYIRFAKGEIAINKKDHQYISDYFNEDIKYACSDLSGDGVPELILVYQEEAEEKLLILDYSPGKDNMRELVNRKYNSEYDYISENGFFLFNYYYDDMGNYFYGRTDNKEYRQYVYASMVWDYYPYDRAMYVFIKEAGSNEYIDERNDLDDEDFNHMMELASDQVVFRKAQKPEDLIPYFEECDNSFEDSIKKFKRFRQEGNGLFQTYNISDIPDIEYEDADTAYEAFLNDETSFRCEYGVKVIDGFDYYLYGDKFTLSSLYFKNSEDTVNSRFIECGKNGYKALVLNVVHERNSDVYDYTYIITFCDGHLYLRLMDVGDYLEELIIDDTGYIYGYEYISDHYECTTEALIDGEGSYVEIYYLKNVSGVVIEMYFHEAYEKAKAEDYETILSYEIDGKEYCVPYCYGEEVTDESDYTDCMKACLECGVSFSTQEEVDALIEERKAEYGF